MYVESNEGVNEIEKEGRKREEKQFSQTAIVLHLLQQTIQFIHVHVYYLEFSLQVEKRDRKMILLNVKQESIRIKGETNRILKTGHHFY